MGDERTPEGEGAGRWGTPPPPRTPGPPPQGMPPPPQPPQPPGGGWSQPQQPPGAWPPPQGPPRSSTNGVAVGALVCGLLALPLVIFLVGGVLGVVAVVLGIVGLARVRVTGSGRGMALTGIIAGGLAALFTVGLVALGVRIWQDPEFQEKFQEEMRRQEELLDQQEQQD